MPTDSYRLGPGLLSLGGTEFNVQLTNCRVETSENVTEGEDLNLLDGSTLDGIDDVTHTSTLSGNAVQDLLAAGLVDYTWANNGDEVAFSFKPVTARDATITGTVRILRLTVGGDVKTRPRSDFTFAIIGEPVWTPDTP